MLVLGLTVPVSVVGAVALLAAQWVVRDVETLSTAVAAIANTAVFILATFLARRFLDRRTFRSLGFNLDQHTLPDLIVGILIPLPMLGLVLALEVAMGWVHWQAWAWQVSPPLVVSAGLAGGLGLFVLVGLSEETLSRGYHLQNLAESMGLPGAWILSSVIFASLHAFNPGFGLQAAVGLVLAGLFLATGWIRTRRLWLSIGLHIGWNFFEGTFFGFEVSGLHLFRLMQHTVDGPAWVTGGPFGPEAGAVLLPGLLLGTALVWVYTRSRISVPAP
jgi:membrane protease YdiL (CAAX protease family)